MPRKSSRIRGSSSSAHSSRGPPRKARPRISARRHRPRTTRHRQRSTPGPMVAGAAAAEGADTRPPPTPARTRRATRRRSTSRSSPSRASSASTWRLPSWRTTATRTVQQTGSSPVATPPSRSSRPRSRSRQSSRRRVGRICSGTSRSTPPRPPRSCRGPHRPSETPSVGAAGSAEGVLATRFGARPVTRLGALRPPRANPLLRCPASNSS
mmetsp:Transcript_18084/g.46307  ORF Transcript_18084/g.46307 Transcript_18084/m.46307 type:complete len:211 (+) Transcript_18084:505-1137(+)